MCLSELSESKWDRTVSGFTHQAAVCPFCACSHHHSSLKRKNLWFTATAVPFSVIHDLPLGFKAQKRRVFIPGQDISVRITDYDRSITTHFLNPNLWVPFTSLAAVCSLIDNIFPGLELPLCLYHILTALQYSFNLCCMCYMYCRVPVPVCVLYMYIKHQFWTNYWNTREIQHVNRMPWNRLPRVMKQ